MSKTHDDSDSDIFGIAAQHVDVDDDDDVALHDTAQDDPIVADIYPPDKSFRVQDPKKNVFKNFHSIERVFSGDKTIPQEVGLNVPRSSSADHEDISDDDSKHFTNRSNNNNQNPIKSSKTPTKSIPISPHSHLLATTKARVHEHDNLQQHQAQLQAEKQQQRLDRSPSPHSTVQTTPISNQSHLLASTKSRAIDHSLAQEQIHHLHQQGNNSKNSSNNNSSANNSHIAAIPPNSHLLATTRNRAIDHSQAQEMLYPPNRRQSHSNSPANSMSTNNVKSRSPSPNRESNNNSVRFSIAEHSYHFGRYSPASEHTLIVSERPFSPVRPISPHSHLLSTTHARIVDHDLAQEQLHQLHPLQNSNPKKHTVQVNNSANFLRPTVAFTQSTDFRLELERRQEKRDIWWEERRKEIKSPLTNTIQEQVKSRLYEPTIAFKESVKGPVIPQGTVSRDISPSRSLSGVKTKALPADSSLLRATQAAKQHYKVTPPPQTPPSPTLTLLGKQSYPQQHQIASKLTCETKAAKLAKWKVAEQLKQEENEKYLAQKNALALAAAVNHNVKEVIPVSTPVKSPSERLLTFNAAMAHQARHKVEIETLHVDPQDQGPGWNKLFTRDRIDSEPFRSRSPSPAHSPHNNVSTSHYNSTHSVHPPVPPSTYNTTTSSTKKVRHSTGTLPTPPRPATTTTNSSTTSNNSAIKAKRSSLSGPPEAVSKAGFGSSSARKIVTTTPQKPISHQTNSSAQKLKGSTPDRNNSTEKQNVNNNATVKDSNNNVNADVDSVTEMVNHVIMNNSVEENVSSNHAMSDVDNVDNAMNTSSPVDETY